MGTGSRWDAGFGFRFRKVGLVAAYYQDQRSDDPEQYRAIGWVHGIMCTLIFEIREDDIGEYCHLVTPWRSTRAERELYEANS